MKRHTTAIVLAAGIGSRMESATPKQYMKVAGYPVLYHTIKAFQDSPIIEEIILVVSEKYLEFATEDIVEKYNFTKVTQITLGGSERHCSVQNGLRLLSPEAEYVMIHDGARPIVSEKLLERAYNSVGESSATIAVMPVKETIKRVNLEGEVIDTPNRSEVYAVQTPQAFSVEVIKMAYENLCQAFLDTVEYTIVNTNKEYDEHQVKRGDLLNITDDAMVVEFFTDIRVNTFAGDYKNIKITTPEDMELAELFINKENKNTHQ